jgi:hypothetical protein
MLNAARAVGAVAVCVGVPAQGHNIDKIAWAGSQTPHVSGSNSLVPVFGQRPVEQRAANLVALRRQFADLRSMPDGWDGAASRAPDPMVLTRAANLLHSVLTPLPHVEAPRLIPVADGGVQAEWHSATHRFEAYFDADGEVLAWSENRSTGVEFEEEGTAALQLLHDWACAREYDRLHSS